MAESSVDKVAVVTGGASGIGLGIAKRLADDGAKVAIFDLNGDAAADEAAKICAGGAEAVGVGIDVAQRDQVLWGIADVRAPLGPTTILINNAGVAAYEPFLKITTETWNRFLDVNLTGTFHCCQAVLPACSMLAGGGS